MITTVQKLSEGRLQDARAGWWATFSITTLAFALRFVNFWEPHKLIFDETYYPKDAYSLLKFGYEREWLKAEVSNPQILDGTPDVMGAQASFAVHPPLGKWLIAVGEQLFGMNPFGWRFMAVAFGTFMVFLTIRLARRLSRSTLVGGIAGLLLTFDGLAFVMSRIGLLDIFQATFTLAAVCCLVADRDWFRLRLASHLETRSLPDLDGAFGPVLVWRPWRLAAGIMFGCAVAVKWNSLYVLAAFGLLSVAWDIGARRLAGAGWAALKAFFVDAPLAFCYLVMLAVAVYVSTWSGWLLTDNGYDRHWGAEHPDDPLVRVIGAPLASLWKLHVDIYGFHTGDHIKSQTHPYASHPATWLLMIRPIGIDAVNGIQPGADGCSAVAPVTCLRVINGMGTPMLWWMAAAALFAGMFWWLSGRDWRFAVPVVGTLSVWLPWFMYANRPIFFFYAVVMVPFTVTGLALTMGKILGPAHAPTRHRRAIIVGTAIALVIINFAFIYPILTDALLPRPRWLLRMWFGTWV